MKVTELFFFPQKGCAVKAEQLVLIAEQGISGDCHSNGGNRQVTIADYGAFHTDIRGLCSDRFCPNIVVDGFSFADVSVGDVIDLGNARVQVTSLKRCFPEECSLAKENLFCPLRQSSVFAKVIKSGTVCVAQGTN